MIADVQDHGGLSTVCIRIAREVPGVCEGPSDLFRDGELQNTLILGRPDWKDHISP
jgi:stage III sporulation protein SpoIIIAA